MSSKDNKRFIRVYKEGTELSYAGLRVILMDKETGVNYLYVGNGYGGGLTPLLGPDGNPVVTPMGTYPRNY